MAKMSQRSVSSDIFDWGQLKAFFSRATNRGLSHRTTRVTTDFFVDVQRVGTDVPIVVTRRLNSRGAETKKPGLEEQADLK